MAVVGGYWSAGRRRVRAAALGAALAFGVLAVEVTGPTTLAAPVPAPDAASIVPSMGGVCLASTSTSALSELFASEPGGVVGADYQRAHPLPDGRVLWTFQDGAIRGTDGQVRIVHNIGVVQDGACFDIRYRGTRDAPRPFLFADITIPFERWYWPLDGDLAADGTLRIFVAEMTEHGPDYLSDVLPTTTKVAVIDPVTLAIVDERPAPDDSAGLYGWSVTSDHEWTYLYAHCYRQFGYDVYFGTPAFDASCSARITVGRVPRGELDLRPEYWDGSAWQPDAGRAAPVITTVGRRVNADQIVWTGTRFLSVNKEGDWWGSVVYLSWARSATGPFVANGAFTATTRCEECNTFFANWVPRTAAATAPLSRVVSLSNNRWDGEPSPSYRPTFLTVPELPYLPPGGVARVHVPEAVGDQPDAAAAVLLNVTTVRTGEPGHFTVHPCDRPVPVASTLNHVGGQVVAGLAVVRPDGDGDVCVASHTDSDLVVDLAGTFAASDGVTAIDAPVRVLDTRAGTGAAAAIVPAGATVRLEVPGWGDLAAVALNVTAAGTVARGHVTAFACDRPRPLASNLNTMPGRNVANLVVVRPDADGAVCLTTSAATHLVADLTAAFGAPSGLVPVDAPVRLVDTRTGDGAPPGRRAPGEVLRISVPDGAGAAAVALNLTAVDGLAPGYATAFPCDRAAPTASNLNHLAHETVANLVVVRPDADGAVCVTTSAEVHLVVDLEGRFDAGGSYAPIDNPRRLVDSRIGLGTGG